MKKILPHITPFLVVSIYLIVLSVYTLITDGKDWGGVAAIAIFVFAIILLIVDSVLKYFVKQYKQLFLTEIIIALVVLLFYYFRFS